LEKKVLCKKWIFFQVCFKNSRIFTHYKDHSFFLSVAFYNVMQKLYLWDNLFFSWKKNAQGTPWFLFVHAKKRSRKSYIFSWELNTLTKKKITSKSNSIFEIYYNCFERWFLFCVSSCFNNNWNWWLLHSKFPM